MTASRTVLDAYALLALLQGEGHAARVESTLAAAEAGSVDLFLSMINVGEVFYRFHKLGRPDDAEQFVRDVTRGVFPVTIRTAGRHQLYVRPAPGLHVDSDTSAEFVAVAPGIAGHGWWLLHRSRAGPTVLLGLGLEQGVSRIWDATGRDVTDRWRTLAPGIYFLRSGKSVERNPVRKVIIQR